MKSIAAEIEKLRKCSLDDLVGMYRKLFGKDPRVRHREHLWKRCAWKIQEQRFGGLSGVARRRLEELIAEIDIPAGENKRVVTGALRRPHRPDDPPVGTVLTRTWRGREFRCTIVDGGYEVDGVLHRSLTAAAKAVTGSHWNGKLFWGLTKRKKAQ